MTFKPQIIQTQGNFFEANIPPLAMSGLKLPQGKYSLGVDSTIPFISLNGGGASQKIFTWGEMIEVQEGQTVRVKNESFMRGDIQLNTGHDYAAIPPKISLPVLIENLPGAGPFGTTVVRGVFPADTRPCRRAYLRCQLQTQVNLIQEIVFLGKPQKHSYPATAIITGQNGYSKVIALVANTVYSEFSMGFGSDADQLTPMALTDQVSFELIFAPTSGPNVAPSFNNVFFYVLEY